MRILAVQPDITWQDATATLAHVEALLLAAKPAPDNLVVLPEMFATGFSMDAGRVAEGEDGPIHALLRDWAMRWQAVVVGGVATRTPHGSAHNQALAFGPTGAPLAAYSKVHPFSLVGEGDHYTAGQAVSVFDHLGWRIAPAVCYDLRFPELFRLSAARGANLLVVIANWPASRIDQWTALLTARAIENQSYVVGVNRVGSDPQAAYNGQSVILDPLGRLLALGDDRPGVVQAQVDLTLLQSCRERFGPLRDMKYRWDDGGFA